MNRYLIICTAMALIACSGNKTADTLTTINADTTQVATDTIEENIEVIETTLPRYTAAQGLGLQGNVKSVADGEQTIYFDEFGNTTCIEWSSGNRQLYKYDAPNRYTVIVGDSIVDSKCKIVCEGNSRHDIDENGIYQDIVYDFDQRGRIVHHRYSNGMMPVVQTYTYDADSNFPTKVVYTYSYETGNDVASCEYTYLEHDKQGNWIKRSVVRSWTCQEYILYDGGDSTKTTQHVDPEQIETRTITYYL